VKLLHLVLRNECGHLGHYIFFLQASNKNEWVSVWGVKKWNTQGWVYLEVRSLEEEVGHPCQVAVVGLEGLRNRVGEGEVGHPCLEEEVGEEDRPYRVVVVDQEEEEGLFQSWEDEK